MKNKTFLNCFLLSCIVLSQTKVIAQTWTAASGNLNTTAAKVGIGTTAPDQKLTVTNGNIALTNTAYPSDFSSTTWRYITAKTDASALLMGTNPNVTTGVLNGPCISMFATNNGWVPGKIVYSSRSSVGGSAGTTASQAFENFNTSINGFVSLMQLHDDNGQGLVVIGSVPIPSFNTYGLLVERGIMTQKIRVAVKGSVEWADYVFDKNYKLMSLNDLEQYINKEKHLPNVPTTEEVMANGVDLGQMQATLLQKVEELTKYVIMQQKEIEMLKKKSIKK